MAKNLNLRVIAEGVENEAQLSFLSEHQCDEIQGYYFSKPLLPEDAAEKLRRTSTECDLRCASAGLIRPAYGERN